MALKKTRLFLTRNVPLLLPTFVICLSTPDLATQFIFSGYKRLAFAYRQFDITDIPPDDNSTYTLVSSHVIFFVSQPVRHATVINAETFDFIAIPLMPCFVAKFLSDLTTDLKMKLSFHAPF